MLLLFLNKGSDTALLTGQQFLWILSPFYFIISIKLVADGILRGISAMGRFMASTFLDLALRVILAFLLSGWMGSAIGIWCAWPVSWAIATVLSVSFYRRSIQKRMEG